MQTSTQSRVGFPTRRTAAFTLLELLTVIAIAAVLGALTYLASSQFFSKAELVNELGAARQLISAYVLYSIENDGRLLPGMADEDATDGQGNEIRWPGNERYPWRLAAYIGEDDGIKGTLLVNDQVHLAVPSADQSREEWAYQVSLFPTFGYNMYFLGGDLTGGSPPLYLTHMAQARKPSQLIVFGSARYTAGQQNESGFFQILSPTFAPGTRGWSATYDEEASSGTWGHVHPRYNGKAVFAFLDGHVELLDTEQMRDMRRWSNDADSPDWTPNVRRRRR